MNNTSTNIDYKFLKTNLVVSNFIDEFLEYFSNWESITPIRNDSFFQLNKTIFKIYASHFFQLFHYDLKSNAV